MEDKSLAEQKRAGVVGGAVFILSALLAFGLVGLVVVYFLVGTAGVMLVGLGIGGGAMTIITVLGLIGSGEPEEPLEGGQTTGEFAFFLVGLIVVMIIILHGGFRLGGVSIADLFKSAQEMVAFFTG